jgi:hypothetical protein
MEADTRLIRRPEHLIGRHWYCHEYKAPATGYELLETLSDVTSLPSNYVGKAVTQPTPPEGLQWVVGCSVRVS